MYKGYSIAAFIPARGGSIRIPNKNMVDLCGKPLIQYTIESAKQSKYVDLITVSSDSDKILSFSKTHDCFPIKRPSNISGSDATIEDAVVHVVSNYLMDYGIIIILQPTSPLRAQGRIDEAIELLVDANFNSIVSVCNKFVLAWEVLSGSGYPKYDKLNRPESSNRGTLVENGSIYGFRIEDFMDRHCRIIHPVGLLLMDSVGENIDVDEYSDLEYAEHIESRSLRNFNNI